MSISDARLPGQQREHRRRHPELQLLARLAPRRGAAPRRAPADDRRRSPARRPPRTAAARTGTARACVDRAPDRAHALAPPRPDRRTDEVDRAHAAALAACASRPRLKSGASTPTNSGTRSATQPPRQRAAQAEELRTAATAPRRDHAPTASRSGTRARSPPPPSAGRRRRRSAQAAASRAPRGSASRQARRPKPRRRRCRWSRRRWAARCRASCAGARAQRTMPRPGSARNSTSGTSAGVPCAAPAISERASSSCAPRGRAPCRRAGPPGYPPPGSRGGAGPRC